MTRCDQMLDALLEGDIPSDLWYYVILDLKDLQVLGTSVGSLKDLVSTGTTFLFSLQWTCRDLLAFTPQLPSKYKPGPLER